MSIKPSRNPRRKTINGIRKKFFRCYDARLADLSDDNYISRLTFIIIQRLCTLIEIVFQNLVQILKY